MKKITVSVGVSVLVVVSSSSAETKTPITDTTYATIQSACINQCFNSKGQVDPDKAKLYCVCVCIQATANCKGVVAKYNLRYEEEMFSHISEIFPNYKQINVCKTRAGI